MKDILTPQYVRRDNSSRVSSSVSVASFDNATTSQVIDKWVLLSVKYDPYQNAAQAEFCATNAQQKLTIVKVRAVLKSRVERMQGLRRN